MGVYLVSVGAQEWFGTGEDGMGEVARALNEELGRRGLPPYAYVPEETSFAAGTGPEFEEKLIPDLDGFEALCRAHLPKEEWDTLGEWSVLVPFRLDEEIRLPVGSAYADVTVVSGAPQVLAVARKLAAATDLPDEVPATPHNLELTSWFMNGPAGDVAAARPGPWSEDLDAVFYVAMYLRAAQHSIRRGCPLVYT